MVDRARRPPILYDSGVYPASAVALARRADMAIVARLIKPVELDELLDVVHRVTRRAGSDQGTTPG
jgi:hypothetical protein